MFTPCLYRYCANMNLKVTPARVVVIGYEVDTYGMLCLRS